jgi:hypothetical protein
MVRANVLLALATAPELGPEANEAACKRANEPNLDLLEITA